MRHLLRFLLIGLALVPGVARAASIAYFYDGDAAVLAGKGVPAPVTEAGVVVPADRALATSSSALVGDERGLYKAVLFRLDNDLNIAVLRKGDAVGDAQTVGVHLKRWASSKSFLSPEATSVEPGSPTAEPAMVAASTQPFRPTINGVGSEAVVVLKKKFNKTKFRLQVVNTSTDPMWSMSIKLTSDPQLSFWKDGRRQGLNEVPTPTFTYEQQSLFKPIKPGESVSVTVEAYYMKGTDYTWTVQARSKQVSGETKFAVRIE